MQRSRPGTLLVPDASGVGQLGGDVAGLYVVGGGSQLPLVARILRARWSPRPPFPLHGVSRPPSAWPSAPIPKPPIRVSVAARVVACSVSARVHLLRHAAEPNTELAPGETLTIKAATERRTTSATSAFVEYSPPDEAYAPAATCSPAVKPSSLRSEPALKHVDLNRGCAH